MNNMTQWYQFRGKYILYSSIFNDLAGAAVS